MSVCNPETSVNNQEIYCQDRENSGQTKLFSERCEYKVTFGKRNQLRESRTKSRANNITVSHAKQSLHQLVTAAWGGVVFGCKRSQPRIEASTDIAKQPGSYQCSGDHHYQADTNVEAATSRGVDHDKKQTEIQNRSSKIALDHKHCH